jgi:hypothetical protein
MSVSVTPVPEPCTADPSDPLKRVAAGAAANPGTTATAASSPWTSPFAWAMPPPRRKRRKRRTPRTLLAGLLAICVPQAAGRHEESPAPARDPDPPPPAPPLPDPGCVSHSMMTCLDNVPVRRRPYVGGRDAS